MVRLRLASPNMTVLSTSPTPAAVGPNYTGFTLPPSGQIQPLANSTVLLPDGSQPGDVLFNSTGTGLVGTRVGTS